MACRYIAANGEEGALSLNDSAYVCAPRVLGMLMFTLEWWSFEVCRGRCSHFHTLQMVKFTRGLAQTIRKLSQQFDRKFL